MSLLDELYRSGGLRTLDHALAQSLRRLEPDTPDEVLAAAALASLAIAQGHAGFDPARPQLPGDATIDWPDAQAWREQLVNSRWVGTPRPEQIAPGDAPLVFEQGLLYLRRYREYERRLASGLKRIAGSAVADSDAASLQPLFAALFPQDGDDRVAGDGGQARAAALALRRSLLLVTGGPGTGKTTTIARVLLLLLAQARGAGRTLPRIALAAPTGRAAERMAESLRIVATQLRAIPGVDAALCDALPQDARTLHRLLGTIPDSPRFRHGADAPLPFDVIVIDEASMVDLPLMCKLVEAVPDGARLILLGDRDQLPSVEAGDVLAAIGDAAGEEAAIPPELASWFGAGGAATPSLENRGPLAGHRVQLRRGYRQSDALDLAPLADAMRNGDGNRALALLRDGALAGVQFHPGLHDPLAGATRKPLLAHWQALMTLDDPVQALACAGKLRLLTALRDGAQGAHALNARIEEALAGAQREPYFHGRLLLVTQNSYRHGLFNGDIGVCLRDPAAGPAQTGAVTAWFADGAGGVRGFHPSALPAHDGAFAMTVHKAQGSEFDEVWLLLPRHDARTLSRELLYTAITRARHALHICASEEVLRAALARHAQRISGLAQRLQSPVR
ncbi:DNA helicase/exodeoxyribonuclease V alpha subunit [Luteimonas cucumeris]|uniref:RecBCD enzyme subunit RecD n=1 Tax=Luteimonas cucumeris TaxID=985012 RepID=A0A562KWJ3_9GAMM|nr:exodeoxyribonuclease V subunit alpha [Luteimonas cucumeris]TWH99716.1 DNA helicase/exodeoxyribonuclease V alpha subunit [Luteimonas cucumeris]